jgi:hypothetical protein
MSDSTTKAGPKGGSKARSGAGKGKGPSQREVQKAMQDNTSRGKPNFPKAYSFALVTAALFLLSWIGQFLTQLITVRNESEEHGQPFEWSDFMAQFLASTFENWQSEFLQLVWQAAGLTLLLFWGSAQSRETDERLETKLDLLLEDRGIDPRAVSESVNRSV